MLAVSPFDEIEEKEAILAALNQNRDLEAYIYDNIAEETEFYILEKSFWDKWCNSVSFLDQSEFVMRLEPKDVIENKKLIEPRH